MAFRFRVRKPRPFVPAPSRPSISPESEDRLTGLVNDMQASAPEERMANALRKNNKQFLFRYVVGAPKGLPGWKEIDFLVSSGGLLYAMEVDTAFTHRNKEQKDKLKDAIILADQNLRQMGTLWPQVIHIDGDSDLADDKRADSFVRRTLGR